VRGNEYNHNPESSTADAIYAIQNIPDMSLKDNIVVTPAIQNVLPVKLKAAKNIARLRNRGLVTIQTTESAPVDATQPMPVTSAPLIPDHSDQDIDGVA
jgi:hypothetical protein